MYMFLKKEIIKKTYDLLYEKNILQPPIPIVDILEDEGYKIQKRSLSKFQNGKAVSGVLLLDQKMIIINKDESEGRQRFTLAYELGHIILHFCGLKGNPELGIVVARPFSCDGLDPTEKEAHCFAVNILVPGKWLKYWYERTQDQIQLSKIFAVSPSVIGSRLLHSF